MEFCQHHRRSHYCVFTNPGQSDSGESSETQQRPLARVMERVEAFNTARTEARHSNYRAAPCPVLVSNLLTSHHQTSHHRDLKHCQDCADFACSLNHPLQCLLQMGNIEQWRSSLQVEEVEDEGVGWRCLQCCFFLLNFTLVLMILVILVLFLKFYNII